MRLNSEWQFLYIEREKNNLAVRINMYEILVVSITAALKT